MYVQPSGPGLSTAYQASRSRLESSMQRLATGERSAQAGDMLGGELSAALRFRHSVKRAEASNTGLQTAMSFLNTADQYAETVLSIVHRMTEVAAVASDGAKTAGDRKALDVEFQALKAEITSMTRTATFNGMQAIGRDVMVSYDDNSDRVRFFNLGGTNTGEITRDFGSLAKDAHGTAIGFSSSEDFTMSRDGKSLFFMGTVAGDAAGVVRTKRYDIESHTVYTGADLFATGDKMFVDEGGSLYVNGAGMLYTVDSASLARTATAVVDVTAGTNFSVYKDTVNYYRSSDNRVVNYDIGSATTTSLTAPIAFAAGDHTFAASGKYIAEESPAGSIRVIDTRSGSEATLAIGAANSVTSLQFNEDGDRAYYVNKLNNTISYINVLSDENGVVSLAAGGSVAQGVNAASFNGLDLGGSNFNSAIDITVAADSVSYMKYEAVDLNTYILGLANSHVDTFTDANSALTATQEAIARVSFRRSKIGAMASRLDHVIQTNQGYIANAKQAHSQLANVDIAKESIELSISQVRNQTASAMLAQFNTIRRNVLGLLQF